MRRHFSLPMCAAVLAAFLLATPARAVEVDVTLRGSPNSMERQNQVAHELGYLFIREPVEIDSLVDEGFLVRLEGNRYYMVNDGVSYPYARPEVRLFIERLAQQYYEGTGEKLVVTSLIRPTSEQPRNSHELSVHPTGIAMDLRISSNPQARAWLESVLLKLERRRLLDITRERWPPHYHVALFTEGYRDYLEEMIGTEAVADALLFEEEDEPAPEPKVQTTQSDAPKAGSRMAATAVASDDGDLWTLLFALVPVVVVVITFLTFFGRREDEN